MLGGMLARFRDYVLRRRFEQRKGLFRYWNGERTCKADPYECVLRLMNHESVDLPRAEKTLALPSKLKKLEALEQIAVAVRDVFDIPPVADGGLTIQECGTLYHVFYRYIDGQKKSGESTADSLQSSDPPEAEPSV